MRAIEAVGALRDIAARGERAATDPSVVRRPVGYAVEGRARSGDLYHGEDVRAGLVLVPGAAEAGKDDPRLVAFARSLARARFAVLVPDIASVRALRVGPEDIRDVADAIHYLSERTAGPEPERVGVTGISYAAGPAILAAMRPETRERVAFVLAIGGYYDLDAAITFFTTGHYRAPGETEWRRRRPNAYGKWVFVRSNAERLDDPGDRMTVAAMAERKLDDLDAPIGDLVARLGPEGRSVHALVTNRDPGRVPDLIAALPEAVRADMAALDIERHGLARLEATLFLVHGRDDPIIPHTESVAMANAAGEEKARLFVVDSMGHTDPGAMGLLDGFKLWCAIYRIHARRDAMTPVVVSDGRAPSAEPARN